MSLVPARPPVFVLGCPRSGTTLVSELLAPTIYGSPVETHFITKYARRLSEFGPLTDRRNFDGLVRQILSERPVMQWKLDLTPDDLWRLVQGADAVGYRGIVDTLCMVRARRHGHGSWGDKTPHFILDLDVLTSLYPDASYIYVVRDGRDVALSLLKKPWGPNNVHACARYWARCHAEWPALAELRARRQLHDLQYETLLQHPADTIRALFGFLGEECRDADMTRLVQLLRRNNFGRWRQDMRPRDVRRFEAQAGDTLRRFGYATSFPEQPASALTDWAWRLHDRAKYSLHLAKMNTVDAIRIRYFGMEPFAD